MRVGTRGPPPRALLTRIWPACRPKLAFHSNAARQGSRPPWTERTTWQPPDQRGALAPCRASHEDPRVPGVKGLPCKPSFASAKRTVRPGGEGPCPSSDHCDNPTVPAVLLIVAGNAS